MSTVRAPVEDGAIVGGDRYARQMLPYPSSLGLIDIDGRHEFKAVTEQMKPPQVSGGHAAAADHRELDDCHRSQPPGDVSEPTGVVMVVKKLAAPVH